MNHNHIADCSMTGAPTKEATRCYYAVYALYTFKALVGSFKVLAQVTHYVCKHFLHPAKYLVKTTDLSYCTLIIS